MNQDDKNGELPEILIIVLSFVIPFSLVGLAYFVSLFTK